MVTIVGLGNKGEEYASTRHNVGWIILERIIDQEGLPSPVLSNTNSGMISEGVYHSQEVRILFPYTFMNKSGSAVAKTLARDTTLNNLIVVHDDIDLPFGSIKVSTGRGSSGHNGVKSIIDTLGTKNFTRIRIGIAQKGFFGIIKRPTGEKLSRFVLGTFTKQEMLQLEKIQSLVSRALTLIVTEGLARAMEESNR